VEKFTCTVLRGGDDGNIIPLTRRFAAAHPTGTLLVDLERHRPVDVLLGSDDRVLAQWLRSHPGVEIICRDRGASYARGAHKGAPHARQVLDRWHLLKNVGEVLQRAVAQYVDIGGSSRSRSEDDPAKAQGSPALCGKIRWEATQTTPT
jgi:transposase